MLQVDIVRSDKTSLQIASHQGFSEVVDLLVQLGANVSLQVSIKIFEYVQLFIYVTTYGLQEVLCFSGVIPRK